MATDGGWSLKHDDTDVLILGPGRLESSCTTRSCARDA